MTAQDTVSQLRLNRLRSVLNLLCLTAIGCARYSAMLIWASNSLRRQSSTWGVPGSSPTFCGRVTYLARSTWHALSTAREPRTQSRWSSAWTASKGPAWSFRRVSPLSLSLALLSSLEFFSTPALLLPTIFSLNKDTRIIALASLSPCSTVSPPVLCRVTLHTYRSPRPPSLHPEVRLATICTSRLGIRGSWTSFRLQLTQFREKPTPN